MGVPVGLGVRGLALWEALSSEDVARNGLVLEAARLADRLDELDSVIQGKGVLNLMQFRVIDKEVTDDSLSINVEVKFQNVLSEARQQATAFAGILRALGPVEAGAATAGAGDGPAATPLDGLMKKIAERRAKTS